MVTRQLDPARLVADTPRAAAVLPGFIDLQINGAFGRDFTSDPASIWTVGRQLPRFAVTAFLPTIISCRDVDRHRAYEAMRARPDDYAGAAPLGLHLEGPLLSVSRSGVHNADTIAAAVSRLEQVTAEVVANADVVAMVTLAPELPGALEAIVALREAGIVVSLGHSDATELQAIAGFDAGATAVTHLFNAMAPMHHRQVGLVGAALNDHRVSIGLIVDNLHVTSTAVQLVWRLVGPHRLLLVTDAVAGLGAPAGRYRAGPLTVHCDLDARTSDGDLAGSMLDMATAAANLRRIVGQSLEVAPGVPEQPLARVLSENQANLLGRPSQVDEDSVVVVDAAGQPLATYIDGQRLWQHPTLAD